MINVAIVERVKYLQRTYGGLLTFRTVQGEWLCCDIYPEKAQAMKEKYQLDCQVLRTILIPESKSILCMCARRLCSL